SARPAGQRSEDWMIPSRLVRRLGLLVALAAAYFVTGKLGLRFALVNPSASAVWAPTGIALAAFLLQGYAVWPAIFLGAFLLYVTTSGSVATAIAIAAGNTLEGLLAAYLVNRFAGGSPSRVFPAAKAIAVATEPEVVTY